MKRFIIALLVVFLTSRPVFLTYATDSIEHSVEKPIETSIDTSPTEIKENSTENTLELPNESSILKSSDDQKKVDSELDNIKALVIPNATENTVELPNESSILKSSDDQKKVDSELDNIKALVIPNATENTVELPNVNQATESSSSLPTSEKKSDKKIPNEPVKTIDEKISSTTNQKALGNTDLLDKESNERLNQSLLEPSSEIKTYLPLLITEVMIGSEINPEKDFWIEFYNPNPKSVSLVDWQIKGVTKGNSWIKLVNNQSVIQAESFFLYSRYSNSSSSALSIKPDFTKSNLALPNFTLIDIQLKNPNGKVVDFFQVDHKLSGAYRSYERSCNGQDWDFKFDKAKGRQNLKEKTIRTFASPGFGCKSVQKSEIPDVGQPDNLVKNNTKNLNYKLINEALVNPKGSDAEGEWVELYNSNNEVIDLTNWYLDDNEKASKPFKINRSIKPSEYLVLRNPNLNLSFKNSADVIRLLDSNKKVQQVVEYSDAKEGQSYARTADGRFEWTPLLTMKKENKFPPPPVGFYYRNVIIKKILPNPNGYDLGNEKIILANQLSDDINLSGWKIMDQKGRSYKFGKFIIPALDEISFNPSKIKLSLSNSQGKILLFDPKNNLIDEVAWKSSRTGQWSYPDGYFPEGIGVEVIEAIDGDTILIDFDDKDWKVRLIGIDSPETVHPNKEVEFYGKEANDYLTKLLVGRLIHLRFDENLTDAYGRLLAYVYLGDDLVNADMLKLGYAKLYDEFPFKKYNEFIEYEKEAKEANLGLWANQVKAIDSKEVIENLAEGLDDDLNFQDNNSEDIQPFDIPIFENNCSDEGLKIQSILPNEEKGKSTEYIQLINTTDKPICLKGWSLDDKQGAGSKPYIFDRGEILAQSMASFTKKMTKINLNNTKDCASLINPDGILVDQICYKKSKKGLVITHQNLPQIESSIKVKKIKGRQKKKKKSSSKSVSKKARAKKIPFRREVVSFQSDLTDEILEGKVAFLYEEGQLVYLKNNNQVYPISYANSNIDFSAAKELLDEGSSVKLAVRSGLSKNQLVSIEPVFQPLTINESVKATISFEWKYLFLMITLFLIGFILKKISFLW